MNTTVTIDLELTMRLAREFGSVVQEWLKTADFREMNERNKMEENPSICHSHDFCDANMAMLEAWDRVVRTEYDMNTQTHDDLWNAAWTIAKAADFYA